MVNFKRLSLKAVIALHDHEGWVGREGGGGNKNNYTDVSLWLCVIIPQYIDTHPHLLHSLSLPLIHTHTQTLHTNMKFGLWQATSEEVWVLEWCEHVELHRLKDGLHRFGLSEVCPPRTEGDQSRKSCNSQCVRVREKHQEFWWHNQWGSGEQY